MEKQSEVDQNNSTKDENPPSDTQNPENQTSVENISTENKLEITNFGKNIYYQSLSIEFLCKIRNQIKFERIHDLKNQIQKDIDKAKSLIKDYE